MDRTFSGPCNCKNILLLPKGIFNVFNALAYTIVTYLVYRLTLQKQDKKYNSFKFIIIQVLFWLFTPAFEKCFCGRQAQLIIFGEV